MSTESYIKKVNSLLDKGKISYDRHDLLITKVRNAAHARQDAKIYFLACNSLSQPIDDKVLYEQGEAEVGHGEKLKELDEARAEAAHLRSFLDEVDEEVTFKKDVWTQPETKAYLLRKYFHKFKNMWEGTETRDAPKIGKVFRRVFDYYEGRYKSLIERIRSFK